MQSNQNLFVALHRWASGQDENFTTEAFAFLLRHLQTHEPSVAAKVLRRLTESLIDVEPDKISTVKIETQVKDNGAIPDIKIESPNSLEVKVSATLSRKQVEDYLDVLKASRFYPNTGLVVLTRHPVATEVHIGALTVRWHQVAQWLEAEISQAPPPQPTEFLVQQFLGFLEKQKATLTPIRSELSKCIAEYQEKHGTDSLLQTRIRSLKPLDNDDLRPLYDLLMMMDEVLASLNITPQPKLDSGQQGAGWIGYNLNGMEYFFYINYDAPDHAGFETFGRVVKEGDISPRIGKFVTSSGRRKWVHTLDLASPQVDFFEKSKENQIRILKEFVIQCLEQAKLISDAVDPDATTKWHP
jgi:hypothetical protein